MFYPIPATSFNCSGSGPDRAETASEDTLEVSTALERRAAITVFIIHGRFSELQLLSILRTELYRAEKSYLTRILTPRFYSVLCNL